MESEQSWFGWEPPCRGGSWSCERCELSKEDRRLRTVKGLHLVSGGGEQSEVGDMARKAAEEAYSAGREELQGDVGGWWANAVTAVTEDDGWAEAGGFGIQDYLTVSQGYVCWGYRIVFYWAQIQVGSERYPFPCRDSSEIISTCKPPGHIPTLASYRKHSFWRNPITQQRWIRARNTNYYGWLWKLMSFKGEIELLFWGETLPWRRDC